jgi:hypothetical protein
MRLPRVPIAPTQESAVNTKEYNDTIGTHWLGSVHSENRVFSVRSAGAATFKFSHGRPLEILVNYIICVDL